MRQMRARIGDAGAAKIRARGPLARAEDSDFRHPKDKLRPRRAGRDGGVTGRVAAAQRDVGISMPHDLFRTTAIATLLAFAVLCTRPDRRNAVRRRGGG